MAEKSKILIIGATGYFGKFIVEASAKAGHPTFALVRESALSNPDKYKLIESFKTLDVTILNGDIHNQASLVSAIKKVDVVISTVGSEQLADQANIIAAIKEAGNVKRFLPSEFGVDVDRSTAVEPAARVFGSKAQIRRAIESEGIPYTFVSSNGFAGTILPTLAQINSFTIPREKVVILGDGNPKVIVVTEEDIAEYTIKAVDDPQTVNKILYMRPPANILSFNEIISLWEKKIGKTLEKTYVTDEEVLKNIEEALLPFNIILELAIYHAILVKGDYASFSIEAASGVEASELYPEVKYTTVDEYLNQFV